MTGTEILTTIGSAGSRRCCSQFPAVKKNRVTVFWLIPAEPERELFCEIIRILAGEFDAPYFEPHLTLGSARDDMAPRTLFRNVQIAPLKLRVRSSGFSAKFTKTLLFDLGLTEVWRDWSR